jgi:hypothetical protein
MAHSFQHSQPAKTSILQIIDRIQIRHRCRYSLDHGSGMAKLDGKPRLARQFPLTATPCRKTERTDGRTAVKSTRRGRMDLGLKGRTAIVCAAC